MENATKTLFITACQDIVSLDKVPPKEFNYAEYVGKRLLAFLHKMNEIPESEQIEVDKNGIKGVNIGKGADGYHPQSHGEDREAYRESISYYEREGLRKAIHYYER